MSTLASKLPQTYSLLVAKASTDLEPSIRQSFRNLRVFHRANGSRGKLYSFRCDALSRKLPSRIAKRLSSKLPSMLSSELSAIEHSTSIAAKTAVWRQ